MTPLPEYGVFQLIIALRLSIEVTSTFSGLSGGSREIMKTKLSYLSLSKDSNKKLQKEKLIETANKL